MIPSSLQRLRAAASSRAARLFRPLSRSWLRLPARSACGPRESGGVGDAGLSTVEVVVLAPVMMLFVLVLAAFGQLVEGRGALDSAARDAARAGSLRKDRAEALAAARLTAEANLREICSGPVEVRPLSAGFRPGGLFTVEVSCQVRGLSLVGLDVPARLSARFTSPLDPLRRSA